MLQSSVETDLEQLYLSHHRWLHHWLARKLGDIHGAADVTHDVFLRLLNAPLSRSIDNPRAFLTTLAQRALCSRWRREALETAYLAALAQQPTSHAPSPEHLALVMETLLEVDRLLDGLPVAVREAFLLSQLDDLRQAEIAQRMGISLATVKRHLSRAAMHCYFSEQAQRFMAVLP